MSSRLIRFLLKEAVQAVVIFLALWQVGRVDIPSAVEIGGAVLGGILLGLGARLYGRWLRGTPGLPWHRVGVRVSCWALAAVAVAAVMTESLLAGLLLVALVTREAAPLTDRLRQPVGPDTRRGVPRQCSRHGVVSPGRRP